MSIKYKVYQSEYPYHIYNRVNNKESLFKFDDVFIIFLKVLRETARTHDIVLHHFLLMQNHFHLMATTPLANLNEFMRTFQSHVSHRVNQYLNRVNHLFGSRYGATVIRSEIYISRLIKYIYQNPIKANLVQSPVEYPFSTLKFYLEKKSTQYGFLADPYLAGFTEDKRSSTLLDLCRIGLDSIECNLVEKSLKSPYV